MAKGTGTSYQRTVCLDCGAPFKPRCPTLTCPGHTTPDHAYPWELKRERNEK